MKSRWVLTDEDVRDLLVAVGRCGADENGDIFYPDVLVGLRRLIPCNISFQLMDVREQRVRVLLVTDDGVQREETVGAESEFDHLFWQEFWNEDGCAGPLRTGDYSTPLRTTYTDRDQANTPLGSTFLAEGIRHEVLVPMTPFGGGTDRRLLLMRDEGPDFTERELLMLQLVRPHLAELHGRRDRELRGVPHLTPRQWEILRQVATGASNAHIARTLGLSEATVRKHLENIFLRLQVLSRTEALARVRGFLDAA